MAHAIDDSGIAGDEEMIERPDSHLMVFTDAQSLSHL